MSIRKFFLLTSCIPPAIILDMEPSGDQIGQTEQPLRPIWMAKARDLRLQRIQKQAELAALPLKPPLFGKKKWLEDKTTLETDIRSLPMTIAELQRELNSLPTYRAVCNSKLNPVARRIPLGVIELFEQDLMPEQITEENTDLLASLEIAGALRNVLHYHLGTLTPDSYYEETPWREITKLTNLAGNQQDSLPNNNPQVIEISNKINSLNKLFVSELDQVARRTPVRLIRLCSDLISGMNMGNMQERLAIINKTIEYVSKSYFPTYTYDEEKKIMTCRSPTAGK